MLRPRPPECGPSRSNLFYAARQLQNNAANICHCAVECESTCLPSDVVNIRVSHSAGMDMLVHRRFLRNGHSIIAPRLKRVRSVVLGVFANFDPLLYFSSRDDDMSPVQVVQSGRWKILE